MQVGVSTASLFLRGDNEWALPLFERLGIDCAEVFFLTRSYYNREYGEKLRALNGKIKIHSVHALTSQFEPQFFNRHPAVAADAERDLEGLLAGANALGAGYYSFHGITRAKQAARKAERDNFPFLVERTRKISDFCRARGVALCLENVEWATYNRPGVFCELAKEIPALRGVLDVKQARLSGFAYTKYLEEMGERLAHVHLSDITEEGKMCLPGKGTFDFDELLRRLVDVGFDGPLLLEAYAGDYGEDEELKASCEYLRELVYKYEKR